MSVNSRLCVLKEVKALVVLPVPLDLLVPAVGERAEWQGGWRKEGGGRTLEAGVDWLLTRQLQKRLKRGEVDILNIEMVNEARGNR